MANYPQRAALVLASAALLSGCQMFGKLTTSAHRDADPRTTRAMASLYSDKGRDLLRSGRPGEAIEAFNLALATGEAPAPAFNGLGVAWARIGRPDVAYRFFKKATMSAPDNGLYAANLNRLVRSPQFTLDMAPDLSAPRRTAAPVQALAAAGQTGPAPAAAAAVRMRSTAPRQVSIVTLPPDTAAPASAPRRAARQGCMADQRAARDCSPPAVQVVTRRQPAPRAVPAAASAGDVADSDAKAAAQPLPRRKTVEMPGTGAAPRGVGSGAAVTATRG